MRAGESHEVAAAARGTGPQLRRRLLAGRQGSRSGPSRRFWIEGEEFPGALAATGGGGAEEAVGADLGEALGQDMLEEAGEEGVDRQGEAAGS